MLNIFIYTFVGKSLITPKYRTKKNRRSKSERKHDDYKQGEVFNDNKKREKNNKIQSRRVNINGMWQKTTQTKMQQVRVSRGKDKASSRKHGASPYAKMTTCGKKEMILGS